MKDEYQRLKRHSSFILHPSSFRLAGVLAWAAALRLGWPGVNLFSFDQARVSLLALRMARDGEVPSLGMQSSTGIPNLPAAAWIFAIPYRLSPDPWIASLFVGFLGTLAVAGVWWLARHAWGSWGALVAAVLFAASPFLVLYSRDIWSQDLLPPLAVLWAVAGVLGVSRRKPWATALHVFLAGFAFQVHYAGIALIPATLAFGIWAGLWRQWRAAAAGGTLAALAALPFLRAVGCCHPSVVADLRVVLTQPSRTDLLAVRQLAEMGVGLNWEWLLMGGGWAWGSALGFALRAGSLAVAVLAGLGLIGVLRRVWKVFRRTADANESDLVCALLAVWIVSAPLTFLSHKTPTYHQYQLAALPGLFVAMGAAASQLRQARWRMALAGLAVAVAAAQSIALAQGYDAVGRRATPGGVGTPLSWPRSAARALMDGRTIVVHAHGDDPETSGDAGAFSVLLWDYPHRLVDGRSALLLPSTEGGNDSAHLFASFPDLPMWGEARAAGVEGEERLLPRRAGEPPYAVLSADGFSPARFEPVGPFTLTNGAQLRGWRAREVGGRLRVTTWWRVVGPVIPSADYHLFHHLRLDPNAGPIAGVDVPTSYRAWRPGDTVLLWADFDMPAAGPLYVDVGMYDWPGQQRSPILERPDDPLAPIRLGPIWISSL